MTVVIEKPTEVDHFLVDYDCGIGGRRRDLAARQRLPVAAQEPSLIHRHVEEIVNDRYTGRTAADLHALHIALEPACLTVKSEKGEVAQVWMTNGLWRVHGIITHGSAWKRTK